MNTAKISAFINKFMAPASILAIVLASVGGQWDAWTHIKGAGHWFFATPHLLVAASIFSFGFISIAAFLALRNNGLNQKEQNALKLVTLGGILAVAGIPFDELWHFIFGKDTTAWSPPHLAIFFGMIIGIFGLIAYQCQFRNRKQKAAPSRPRFDLGLLLLFVALLVASMFVLMDFDLPDLEYLAQTRPGFAYPVALTGITTFVLMCIVTVAPRFGFITVTTLTAWIFYAGTGFAVGIIGGSSHTLPPFPSVIPAFIIDLLVFTSLKKRLIPLLTRNPLVISFTAATICYWSAIYWTTLYAKLPQQLSGTFIDWLMWYTIFIPPIALFSALVANFFARWTLQKTDVLKNRR